MQPATGEEVELERVRAELGAIKATKEVLTAQVVRLIKSEGLRKAEAEQLREEIEQQKRLAAIARRSVEESLAEHVRQVREQCEVVDATLFRQVDAARQWSSPASLSVGNELSEEPIAPAFDKAFDKYSCAKNDLFDTVSTDDAEVPSVAEELLACCNALRKFSESLITYSNGGSVSQDTDAEEGKRECPPLLGQLVPSMARIAQVACNLDPSRREKSFASSRQSLSSAKHTSESPLVALAAALDGLEDRLNDQFARDCLKTSSEISLTATAGFGRPSLNLLYGDALSEPLMRSPTAASEPRSGSPRRETGPPSLLQQLIDLIRYLTSIVRLSITGVARRLDDIGCSLTGCSALNALSKVGGAGCAVAKRVMPGAVARAAGFLKRRMPTVRITLL